jgi:hypothetical protein
VDGANVAAFGDDGLGGELAYLELGPLRFVFRFRLIAPNGGVLVPWEHGAAFFLCTVGGADLYQFRSGGDGLRYVRSNLRLIAGRVSATVALSAQVIAKEQLVVSRSLEAIRATASRGNKLRVPLVERSVIQDQQDVRVNPEL